ncbi:MAG: ornithine cyclodeaminase family protein [Dehalococcoidales bacterium]|nr:ornithine cyclodeaminase family protein [Dehalococcoidales bacterium]
MPAALPGAAGMKWVNVHPANRAKGLPSVMALIIYSDAATGYPLAIMDATDITAFRTGATAAIAAKYLARKNSKTLGIIGGGKQAETQIKAHAMMFKLVEIRIYDIDPEAINRLRARLPEFTLTAASIEQAMNSDIVCTLTPAHAPVVKKEWVKPGLHINAVGADAEGKEELEPAILRMATVVVDDFRQAVHAGEINVPISRCLYTKDEIYASLGEIILGQKPGRASDKQITIFDSTGVAIEDIATAKLIYDRAVKQNIGLKVDILE